MVEAVRTDDRTDRPAGHEASDVSVRGILTFAAGFVVVAAVLHVLLWWLMQAMLPNFKVGERGLVEVMPGRSAPAWLSFNPDGRLPISAVHF